MQQESLEQFGQGLDPQQLPALFAHANGDHANVVVDGCPACAEREALWSAVVAGDV